MPVNLNKLIDLQEDRVSEYQKASRNISLCIIIPILAVICYSGYHIYEGHLSHRHSRSNHELVKTSQQV